MADIEERREAMVDCQVAARGVTDDRVLNAMRTVPRERFVPDELVEYAYEDTPLPIEAGQTISQPYVVALMLEAAEIQPDDRILEIGVGSGYAAAVMSRIARRVHAIDRHEQLAGLARERMAALGYDNVVIRAGDGTQGWPQNAPFDVILVAAGAPIMPKPLREQLALGGRLVIPVGDAEEQRLIRVTRTGDDHFIGEDLGAVRFVPLIGEHGWRTERDGAAPAARTIPNIGGSFAVPARWANMARVPEATPQERLLRYNNGAVFLHWLMALIIVTQVVVGFTFAGMERGPSRGELFTVHKTLGATILLLALVRLAWRLGHPPPPFPTELPRWERIASVWTHRAFYLLLIALPLTGLMAVSGAAGAEGKTTTPLLGDIPLPLIPGISEDTGERLGGVHELLVFLTLALLVLHVAAALKHQIQRNRAAGRMPPFRTTGEHPTPLS